MSHEAIDSYMPFQNSSSGRKYLKDMRSMPADPRRFLIVQKFSALLKDTRALRYSLPARETASPGCSKMLQCHISHLSRASNAALRDDGQRQVHIFRYRR